MAVLTNHETLRGRYTPNLLLGEGRVTKVYEAYDSLLEKPVALKILPTHEANEVDSFKKEFQLLSQINHPQIVQALDFGYTENGYPFFVSELIDGKDFKSFAQALKIDSVISLFIQLLETLDFLHLLKITHGDLKPANILIQKQDSGNATLELIDLGFATAGKQHNFTNWKGTLGYIAPEILCGEEYDHRADLYSLGVILYEIVTGGLPFGKSDPLSQAKSQLESNASLIFPESFPESLRSMTQKLLKRNPEERYQSAFEVIQEIEKLSDKKSNYSITASSLVTSHPLEAKDSAFTIFKESYTDIQNSQKGKFTLITGELGVGKSSFLKECEIFCQLEGVTLVRYRTVSNPEDKSSFYPILLKQLKLICEDVTPDLLKKYEMLYLTSGSSANEKVEKDSGAKRSEVKKSIPLDKTIYYKTLSDFVFDVSKALYKPLVITIDDVSLLEIEDLDWLSYLSSQLGNSRILILAALSVGSSQSETDKKARRKEEKISNFFDSNLLKVELRPLIKTECITFLNEALSLSNQDQLWGLIYSKTGGNFLLIEKLLEFLSDRRGIFRAPMGLEVEETLVDNFNLPEPFVSEIEERLKRLTFESLNILSTAAILGIGFESKVLLEILRDTTEDIYSSLNEIILEGLLRFEKSNKDEKLCFANGLVREYIYKKIDPIKIDKLHKKAGDVIQEINKDDIDKVTGQLAYHYYLGKDFELGFKYSILAGEKAEKKCDYENAISFYLQSLEYYQESFGKFLRMKEEILEKVGLLHDLMGEPLKGLDYLKHSYAVLREKQASPKFLSKLLREIGNIYLKLGEFDEAILSYEKGLKLLSQTNYLVEKTNLLNELGLAYQRKQELPKALSYLRESIETLEKEKLEVVQLADAYRLTGVVFWMEGEYESSFSCYSKSAEIYKKVRDSKGEGMVWNNLGILYFDKGEPQKALEYLNKVLAIPEIHNDTTLLSSLYNNLSVSYIELCEWEKAEKACRENMMIKEKLGSQDGIATAFNNLGYIHSQKGLLDQAYAYHQRAKRNFERLNQKLGIAKSIYLQAIIYYQKGEFSRGIESLGEAISIFKEFSSKLGLADSLCLLGKIRLENNEVAEAENLLREALKLYEQQKHNFGIVDSLNGLTLIALNRDNFNEAEAYLAQVDKLLSENQNPYLLALFKQTRGVYSQQNELLENALEELSEAAKTLRKIHSKYELANTYVLIGEIKRQQKHLKASRQYLNQALVLFKELQNEKMVEAVESIIQNTGDLGAIESDRLNTVYKFSSLVNEVFDTDELLKISLDLAISLLGAERGAIILVNAVTQNLELKVTKQIESETKEDALKISKQVITEVTKKEEPLIIEDAQLDSRVNRNMSVVMYNILSILCVPLKIRGEVVGTIYLDHRSIPNVFSREDLEFMKAFGNLISAVLEKSQLYQNVSDELFQLRNEIVVKYNYPEVIGKSERMQEIFSLIERVANSRTSVLLVGESGTGKELIANLICKRSNRADKPFVKVNCAALPESLLESELFGIEEKVATGVTFRKGKFEQANGGTFFLDEVGDLSLSTQAKVLRVLQEREFERVGGSQTIQVDVRIIAATNMDLEEKIQNQTFRKDLYYRLNPITIKLPPLRERKEDIHFLVDFFVDRFTRENGKPKLKITSEVMAAFLNYPWPGNVRELSNVIEQGVLLSEGNLFPRKVLPLYLRTGTKFPTSGPTGKLNEILKSVERQIIASVLESFGWNQSKAAKKLGLPESTLRRKMDRLKVQRPSKI